MKINEKIKELREAHNWSQEDIAKKINIAPSSYAKIERGETRMTLERLEQFADIFDIEISQLIQTDHNPCFQFNENSNGYIYNNSHITKSDQQAKIEQLQLIIKHKEELNIKLQEQIDDLRQLISALNANQKN